MEGESPPSRTTILGSFLRGRPRNSSQSLPPPPINTSSADAAARAPSPGVTGALPPPLSPNPSGGTNRNNRRTIAGVVNTTSNSQPSSGLAAPLSNILRRRRSAGNVTPNNNVLAAALAVGTYSSGNNNRNNTPPPPPIPQHQPQPQPQPPILPSATAAANPNSNSSAHRIRLVPHLDSRRSLRFDAIGRDLREGDPALRIGRFTDRSGMGLAAINSINSNKLAFRSKVVSRAHAEIWVETGGKFFIRDTKSSSGTFLNHVRLSAANTESRPFQIKDGDILQLGVDYQGGAEDIYKSVKIRVEIGREWQAGANAFNTAAFKNLRALALPGQPGVPLPPVTAPGKNKSLGIPDCCICLFSVTIRQALFIAPCSHTFHYKCIRPILEAHHPAFSCPLCRTFADLEEDVEVDEGEWDISEEDDIIVNPDHEATDLALAVPGTGVVIGENSGDGNGNVTATGNANANVAGGSGNGIGADDRMDVDQDYQEVGGGNNDDAVRTGVNVGIVGRWRSTSVVHEVPEPDDTADMGEEDVDSDVAMNANAQGMRMQMNGNGMGISSAAGDGYIYPTSLPNSGDNSANLNVNGNANTNNRNTIIVPSLAHTFTPPPPININNNNLTASNVNNNNNNTINNGNGNWGSPGAGSSTSARGESPVPLNLQGSGGLTSVEITGGLDDLGIVSGGGNLGMGLEGETVGKRKR